MENNTSLASLHQPHPRRPRRRDALVATWQLLRPPLLLTAVAVLTLAVLVASRSLPQLPGQYSSDPASATRWLLEAREQYGAAGSLLAGLGLFDVLHSLLLRFLLVVLGLLLLIQLGDLLVCLDRLYRLPRHLSTPVGSPGDPLPIPGSFPVYRSCVALEASPEQMGQTIGQRLSRQYGARPEVAVHAAQVAYTEPPSSVEQRHLVIGRQRHALLRPFFLLGILLALGILWLGIGLGWEVTPPVLAPGREFRFPARSLSIYYDAATQPESDDSGPTLRVKLGKRTGALPIGRAGYMRLGGTGVWARVGPPGLHIESEPGSPALSLPGRNQLTRQLGFVFPTPGSEQAVLIPDAGAALRIVRLASGPKRFLVEVFTGAGTDAAERFEIEGDEKVTITAFDGTTENSSLVLQFRYMPGLQAQIRYLPGDWFLVVALAFVLIGAVGFLRRPFFVLVQLGPWPSQRSVLVVQSDRENPLEGWDETEARDNAAKDSEATKG